MIADPESRSSIFLAHHEGGALNTEYWPMVRRAAVLALPFLFPELSDRSS